MRSYASAYKICGEVSPAESQRDGPIALCALPDYRNQRYRTRSGSASGDGVSSYRSSLASNELGIFAVDMQLSRKQNRSMTLILLQSFLEFLSLRNFRALLTKYRLHPPCW